MPFRARIGTRTDPPTLSCGRLRRPRPPLPDLPELLDSPVPRPAGLPETASRTDGATGFSTAPTPSQLRCCALLDALGSEALDAFAGYLDLLRWPSGATVVAEGELGTSMFVLLEGEARLERHRVELHPLAPGDVFGELGLVTGRPRAATITAHTPLLLARLTRSRFDAMLAQSPALAAAFLQALVGRVGRSLVAMTDSMGILLSERSLPRRTHVRARLGVESIEVPMGTVAGTLVPAAIEDAPVVAVLLDRKAVSLATPLLNDARIEPLTTRHWEGREIYRHSAGLVLQEAAHRVDPALVVRIGGTLGGAQAVEISGAKEPIPVVVGRLNAAFAALVAADVPIRDELWAIDEAREHLRSHGWTDAAELLDVWRISRCLLVSCGELYILSPGPLLPRTGLVRDVRLVDTANGPRLEFGTAMRLHLPTNGTLQEEEAPPPDDAEMARAHRGWLENLGVSSVGAFNKLCVAGRVGEVVRVAEGFHEKRISDLADQIVAARPRVRVICIAGPSSSGKTTFIKRLTVQLQVNGLRPLALSLDDYYVDRERTPRDELGDFDFEAFDALDAALLQRQVGALLDGETVTTAHYDFKTGRSHPEGGRRLAVGPHDVLMLEGIHGLNPALLAGISPDAVFRVFIHPATALPLDRSTPVSTADLRLMRRIVRDRHQRGYSAADTIERWPSVRRGERRHIFPYLLKADVVFDSALAYELGVLKVYADQYLLEVPHGHPAYTTAFRLRTLLDRYVTIYPDQVPPTSIVREFIGGSGFEY